MRLTSVTVAVGAVMLMASPALAIEARFDFGKMAYGTHVATLPRWAVSDTCGNPNQERFADCVFFDRNGVEYTVFDGHVLKKRIEVGKISDWVPYGISPRDREPDVVRKLERRLGVAFFKTGLSGDGAIYNSEPLKDPDYDGLIIDLTFDGGGKLIEIELTSDYV